MNLFGDFLGKYRHLIVQGTKTKEIIAEEINRVTGLSIMPENSDLKRGVIHITVSPAERATIFMYKKTILAAIAARMEGVVISDIR